MGRWVRPLSDFGRAAVDEVGGKNASLGEMLRGLKDQGVRVPEGLAITAGAYRAFLKANGLDAVIAEALESLDPDDDESLARVGARIRRVIGRGEFPSELADEIVEGYRRLGEQYGQGDVDVAVRSSATAEDLPDASFAGQQETVLNVTGEDEVLDAIRYCYASLFTDRAIAYRHRSGYSHLEVALSVGVQKMVRASRGCSGVMFTLDPDTGFPNAIVVNGAWGLGEHLVGGHVDPDEWVVFKDGLERGVPNPIIDAVRGRKQSKQVYAHGEAAATKVVETRRRERESFVLDVGEVLQLARWAADIERHYGCPMDIEWAKDGESGELFVLQARPETVQSRVHASALKTYTVQPESDPVVTGIAVGNAVATGRVRVLATHEEGAQFEHGDVLVTEMTDPDWGPLMARAGAIVTDRGGRTAHAAIISRELGIPAVVGTGNGTRRLADGDTVTVSCAEGDQGRVYEGAVPWSEEEIDLDGLPRTRTKVMLILGSPGAALRWWKLPADGVGLARMEFIINDHIMVHPLALLRFDDLTDPTVREEIEELAVGYRDLGEYFVTTLASGIARIAASRYPDPVVVRTSDFKSNEYADLIGGAQFEPQEANPMLGWRGASRYYSEAYREAFALECRALRRVREQMGLDNIIIMLPFVRTVEEAERVQSIMADEGLERGREGLQLYVMCEVPANVFLASELAQRFDGFSIGSNDLTQLVLGVDRDSAQLAHLFDESDPAVLNAISTVIDGGHAGGAVVGICGQGPSDKPQLTEFLVRSGIDSISINPDALVGTRRRVAAIETESTD